MSNLSSDFHFSQSSLQDYSDCPRRFQLRYLLNLAWPAVEAEPVQENEQRMLMGGIFHQLIHQHLLGLPQERLTRIAADEHLARWWHNYMKHAADLSSLLNLAGLQTTSDLLLYPEVLLSAPFGNYRLVAKYDLIAIQPGVRFFIIDWKTTRKPPSRQWLEQRLQTRVYPYLLVQAGAYLNAGSPIEPGQVEMIYWFAEQPDEIRRLPYNHGKYIEDNRYLVSLVSEIESMGGSEFTLTSDRRRCSYCKYRSYCDRGIQAGALDKMESGLELIDEGEIAIDFEHIAEIEF